MKRLTYFGLLCASIPFLFSDAAIAQVIPDSSLAAESSVVAPGPINGQPTELIGGGATRGENLFHSFESFSVPAGQSIYFIDPASITRIFSRVTGKLPSDIQGHLGVLGGADLFFVNSNGIVFGPDAQLELGGGSFIASTANNIKFADGIELSTSPSTNRPPLLSNSVPVGLGLLGNSPIAVNNTGREFVKDIFFDELTPKRGLAVAPSQTLALIGGDINLNGGILRSLNGEIELAGLQEGTVSLSPEASGWNFSYPSDAVFGNVALSGSSLIEGVKGGGLSGGRISIHGSSIGLSDGSIVASRNVGQGLSEPIEIVADDSLRISSGVLGAKPLVSAVFGQNLGTGRSADILVSAPQVTVQNGGQILSNTFSSGDSGDILINAPEAIRVDGFIPASEDISSSIIAVAVESGRSGRFMLNAGDVVVSAGGLVGTIGGSGTPGNVDVTAQNITVEGALPTLFKPSFIGTATAGARNAGQLSVDTNTLRVLSGGAIGTSTIGSGNAGNTLIRANDFVEVSGSFPGAINPSSIDSSATVLNPIAQIVARATTPTPLTGDAGSVTISTPRLLVQEGGAIRVQNDGSGNAGTLNITSSRFRVDSAGKISATTNGGQGGNIQIDSTSLLAAEQAAISASASGDGQGGNVTINSDGIALLPGSSITANAEQGAGGRVVITADALLRSPDTTITATSAAGPELNGFVDIQAPDTTPQPESRVTPDVVGVPELTAACTGGAGPNEFVVTGRGGLPRSPASIQQSYSGWQAPLVSASANPVERPSEIIEAQGWVSNGDGTVNFTAQPSSSVLSAQKTACVHGLDTQNRSR